MPFLCLASPVIFANTFAYDAFCRHGVITLYEEVGGADISTAATIVIVTVTMAAVRSALHCVDAEGA